MITGRIFRDGRLEYERPFDAAEVEACRADGARRIWLDVVDPTDGELEQLGRSSGRWRCPRWVCT